MGGGFTNGRVLLKLLRAFPSNKIKEISHARLFSGSAPCLQETGYCQG